MVYFFKSLNQVCSLEEGNLNLFCIKDANDLRNYAFLYVYPDNTIEAVIRTANLSEHIYALLPLSKVSNHLKKYSKFISMDDYTHSDLDYSLAKSGVLEIFYSSADLRDTDAFGYIHVPSKLTDYQKKFIREHRLYFEVYEEILINQFCEEEDCLKELNQFQDGTFLEILDDLSDSPFKGQTTNFKR